MNSEIYEGTEVSTGRRKPSDLVAEYDIKVAAIPEALASFREAETALDRAMTIGGQFSYMNIRKAEVSEIIMKRSLLRSAWMHCWAIYGLDDIASASKKQIVERMFEDPPPFTVDEIRAQFGDLISDPWQSILRGLAEVFSSLDQSYKSHEKVKIGVKGLPKRVIIQGFGHFGFHGRDKIRDILNAIAAYQRKPLASGEELAALMDDGNALRAAWRGKTWRGDEVEYPGRGVWLKRFGNGNGHLFFDEATLIDVNRALAEFYGDVLPDAPDENPQRRASTAVSKDLQFYPTPKNVVTSMLSRFDMRGKRVLEPSCGDGAILEGLRAAGAIPFGIEVDQTRASKAREKGFNVLIGNFLEQPARPDFDAVVMNPPFYGRHYAKHVRHALKWIKPGGVLVSILPATARYDHHELDDLNARWIDLPVGSFSESGTNINTCIMEVRI